MHLFKRRRIPWILAPIVGLVLVAATVPAIVGALASPTISTSSLPDGEVGSIYAQTLAATGGTSPYTWSVSAGSLPAGLTLSTAGVISGTPTTAATSNFTVKVTDSASATATAALSITVHDNLAVATLSLANGSLGVSYSQTLAASGGVAPFSWSMAGGSTLPAGLSLNGSTGAISGIPTAAGTSNFNVMVTDNVARTAVGALSITISSGLVVATTSLPGGTVGTAYSQTLAAAGGVSPFTWSVSAGSLPAGLTLSAAGVISGTPTTAQTATFTVMVTDSASHTATQALSITVKAALTLTNPSTPENPAGFPALDELTDRVQAVCGAIATLDPSVQKVEQALCDFFNNSSQLSPSVRNAVGHLILKIAGVMGKGEDKDDSPSLSPASATAGNGDDHGKGNDARGDDHSSATVTPTPATSLINHLSISPTPKGKGNSEKGSRH